MPLLGTPIFSFTALIRRMVRDSTVVNGANINAVDLNPNVTNPLPFRGLSTCVFGGNPTVLFNSPIDAANRTVNKLIQDYRQIGGRRPHFPIDYPPPLTVDGVVTQSQDGLWKNGNRHLREQRRAANARLDGVGAAERHSFQYRSFAIDTWTGTSCSVPVTPSGNCESVRLR